MMKFLKYVSSFVLAVVMLFSQGIAALAEAPSVTFAGFSEGFDFKPGSEYTETDLFENFKGVMPGDILTEEITFSNIADDCDFVHLYMRAVPHDENENVLSDKVAETENVVGMAEFLSQLSMKIWNGTDLIYDASPDKLDGLAENVFLGTFRSGETAVLKVELTVPKTLGNEFAHRVGEVDWVFHVEAYNESQLSVRKVWSDGNANHAGDAVSVNLLKDGVVAQTVELNAGNGWSYTFDRLLEGHVWTVEEAQVPEGYTVSYDVVGTSVTIMNTKKEAPQTPDEPLDIVAKKVWSSDEVSRRPAFVTVTLYNGKDAYETVKLSAENNWTYQWKNLSAAGNWQVQETNIPRGYTPSYSVSGNVVTITNTYKLIQTGQLNWPIAVLGGVGVVLIALGGVMLLTKKKRNDV